jgi:hypothetical protein
VGNSAVAGVAVPAGSDCACAAVLIAAPADSSAREQNDQNFMRSF